MSLLQKPSNPYVWLMLVYVMIHFESEKYILNYMFPKQSFLISKTIQNSIHFLFEKYIFFLSNFFLFYALNKQTMFLKIFWKFLKIPACCKMFGVLAFRLQL